MKLLTIDVFAYHLRHNPKIRYCWELEKFYQQVLYYTPKVEALIRNAVMRHMYLS